MVLDQMTSIFLLDIVCKWLLHTEPPHLVYVTSNMPKLDVDRLENGRVVDWISVQHWFLNARKRIPDPTGGAAAGERSQGSLGRKRKRTAMRSNPKMKSRKLKPWEDDSEVENNEKEEENDEEEADDEDNAEEDQVTLPLSETLRFAPALPPATNDEDHDGQAVNLDEGDDISESNSDSLPESREEENDEGGEDAEEKGGWGRGKWKRLEVVSGRTARRRRVYLESAEIIFQTRKICCKSRKKRGAFPTLVAFSVDSVAQGKGNN